MDGLELNIDVSAFEQADKHLESIVHNAQNLKKTLSALLSGTDIAHVQQIMGQLSDSISAIEKTTVSPKFDVAKAEDMFDVMQKIVYAVQNLSSHGTIEFFDPKHLYESGRYVGDILNDISSTEEALKKIDDKWKSGKGFVAPTHSDGTEYRKTSAKYQQARAAYNMELEIERRQHQERLKMLQAELDAANMTAMEKVAFADKVANANARANDKVVKGMKSQYKDTLREMKQLLSSITALENKNTDNEFDSQIAGKEQRFQELNARRRNLEEKLGSELVDIAKRYNAEILDIEVRRIEQKKQKEEEARQASLRTPQGALANAEKATTINEMKEAQKFLQEARNNTNVDDTKTIQDLNNAYIKLRATIEDLTKAEKNEQSLQPTLRNEYMRLRKELDKVQEAFKKGEDSDAWQSFAKGASKDNSMDKALDALIAREEDLQRRINEIKEQAGNRLDEVDRQFEAEKAQREIAETERVEKEKAAIRAKHLKDFSDKINRYGAVSSSQVGHVLATANKSQNLIQEEAAIKKLLEAKARLNRNDENYEKTLAKLDKAIVDHTHQVKMLTDETYRQKEAEKIHTTYDGALKYKKEATTLEDQIKAVEYLKIARQKLDKSTMSESDYEKKMKRLNKEIRRSQREINLLEEDFKNFNSKAGDLIGQLTRKFALLFSVSAINGYVSKLANVRGEFELQQRSIQTLIGSQEEANVIWNKTVALATKSPYKVQELVTYTKQLAAYRIEASKLHDTTKILADVSAGLGVDMNRIILAYGQVKAANYLRGTELRQFSEAGVNVLKELADYFTVVEGRAVSVGDVFERVSKRMVTFEHVNTVFEKLTSEGGQFYQMQEKQSETLKGMLMNFEDSIDLMLNDIGEANDGVLKGSVAIAKTLVDNWRQIAPFISAATTALVLLTAKAAILKLQTSSIVAGWKALPVIILSIAAGVVSWWQAQSKLNFELGKIDTLLTKTLNESLYQYEKLAKAATDITKREHERYEALQKLQSIFKDILPDHLLELEYIQGKADAYDEAAKAMENYYNRQAIAQKRAKAEELLGQDIDKEISNILSAIETRVKLSNFGLGDLGGASARKIYDRVVPVLRTILHEVVEEAKQGEREIGSIQEETAKRLLAYFKNDEDVLAFWKEINSEINEVKGFAGNWTVAQFTPTANAIDLLVNHFATANFQGLEKNIDKFKKMTESLGGLPFATEAAQDAFNHLEKEEQKVNDLISAYDNLGAKYSAYFEEQKKLNKAMKDPTATEEEKKHAKDAFSAAEDALEESIDNMHKLAPEYTEVINAMKEHLKSALPDKGEFTIAFSRYKPNFIEALRNAYNPSLSSLEDDAKSAGEQFIKTFQEGLSSQSANAKWTKQQEAMVTSLVSIVKASSLPLEHFVSILPQSGKSAVEMAEIARKKAEELREEAEAIKKSHASAPAYQAEWVTDNIRGTKEEAELKTTIAKYMDMIANAWGHVPKNQNKGKDWFAEMGKAIRDTHKDFLTLHKDLNETKALNLAMEKHSDVFEEAAKGAKMVGLSLRDFSRLLVEDNAISALEDLLERIPESAAKSRLAIKKMIGELRGGEEVRQAQEAFRGISNRIEDIFGTYELSVELKEMNIPDNIAERLFGIETLDLSKLRQKVLEEMGILSYELSDAEIIKQAKKSGMDDERIKLLEETLQKIANKEREEQLARSKNYIKYLRQAESERVQIHAEAARKIKEIDSMSYGDAIDKQRMKEAVNAERDKKLQEQEWKAFKSSDMYLTLFADLNSLGKQATARLIDNLNKLKKSLKELDPSDLKAITDEIKKLEEHQIKQDPFGAMLESFKEVYALRKKGHTFDSLQTDLVGSNQRLEEYRQQIDEYSFELQRLQGMTFDDKLSTNYIENEQQKKDLSSRIADTKELLEYEEQHNATIQENIQSYRNMQKSVAASNEIISTFLGHAKGAYGSIKQILAALGVEADSNAMIFADMGMDLVECIAQGVQLQLQIMSITVAAEAMGVAMNTALGIIGWINIALQAIASVFTAIFNVSDNEKKKQIEQLKLQVDDLSASFEKLEIAMHNALTTNDLDTFTKASISNLEAQNSALEAQIAIESTRKHKNEQDMRGWQKTIEENEEKMRELEEERIKELGGVGGADEIKGAAQDFVDAWLDAFLETGNGLVGLEEQFDEWAKNLVKKQLLNQVAGQIISPLATKMNDLVKDGEMTDQDWADWDEAVAKELPIMNARMQKFVEDMGAINDLSTQAELGGLQEGIKSIQENTAQEIVAYMNSLRFLISDRNDSVANIGNMLTENFTTYVNPMLSQLEAMANETATISKLLSSIITNHPNGGNCVRVVD